MTNTVPSEPQNVPEALRCCLLLMNAADGAITAAKASGDPIISTAERRRLALSSGWLKEASPLLAELAKFELRLTHDAESLLNCVTSLIDEATRWLPQPGTDDHYEEFRRHNEGYQSVLQDAVAATNDFRDDLKFNRDFQALYDSDRKWPILGFANLQELANHIRPSIQSQAARGDMMQRKLFVRLIDKPQFSHRELVVKEGYRPGLVMDTIDGLKIRAATDWAAWPRWAFWTKQEGPVSQWSAEMTPAGQTALQELLNSNMPLAEGRSTTSSNPKTDSEGVHLIAQAVDPIADVVFVHGLGGKSHATWQYGKPESENSFFWPDELASEFSGCNVWVVGYAAGFTELGNPGMIIEKRAGNLAHQMAILGIGARPIIFITHSMGGLIVKSMIVSSQMLDDVDRKRISDNVLGIVFCGTPHRGSAFASAAGVLGRALGGTQPHVNEMASNAEMLDLMHDKFLAWHRQKTIAIESYAESIGLYGKGFLGRVMLLGMVVPRASANVGIGQIYDVDADHLTLVKPSPEVQPIYNIVYLGINRFVRELLKSKPTEAVTEESRVLQSTGTQSIPAMFNQVLSESAHQPLNKSSSTAQSRESIDMSKPKVGVSYSWKDEKGGANAGAVDAFCNQLAKAGAELIRDVDEVKHGDSLSKFMRTLGASNFLCVFLSDAYLRSPNCMYELHIAWQKSRDNPDEFRQRVKVWVMPGSVSIRSIEERLKYTTYWMGECERVRPLIQQVALNAPAAVVEFRRITEFSQNVDDVLAFFADTLTPATADDFQKWIQTELAIEPPAIDEAELAEVYANTASEIEDAINYYPSTAEYLKRVTNGLVQKEGSRWMLTDQVKSHRFPLVSMLQGIAKKLNTFNGSVNDWKCLGEVAGGLVVLGIDREWVASQRESARALSAEYPADSEAIRIGEGRQANLLHLVTSALADGRAKLENVFGKPPLDPFRAPDPAQVMRGTMSQDINHEIKLHFIRFVLGEDQPIDESKPKEIEILFTRTKDVITSAYRDDHTPYHGGVAFKRLVNVIRDNLKIEDFLLVFPSGEDPKTLLQDNVRVLKFLGIIFDAVKAKVGD